MATAASHERSTAQDREVDLSLGVGAAIETTVAHHAPAEEIAERSESTAIEP